MRSGYVRDTLIILGITGSILISGELVLRAVYGSQQAVLPDDRNAEIAFQPHPVYLAGLKPNLRDRTFRRWTEHGPVITHWSTNAASFRGAEIKEKTGVRIIVYGDSNIFARFSDIEDTFPYQLEQMLRSTITKSVEVLNGGVPGFGPDQSLLRFEQDIDVYSPDVVVFQVFADNDFGDLIRNQLFTQDLEGHLVRISRENDMDVDPCFRQTACGVQEDVSSAARRWASSLLVVQAGKKTMKLIGLLDEMSQPTPETVIKHYLEMSELEFEFYVKGKRRSTSHFVDHYDYDVALFPDWLSSRVKVRLMEAVVLLAYQTAQVRGVKFLLLVEPSSRDLTTNLRPNYENMKIYSGYRKRNLSGAVAEIAKKYMIPFVDLYDVFLKNNPSELYWHDTDDHWSNAGQRLAAFHVATFLKAHFLHD